MVGQVPRIQCLTIIGLFINQKDVNVSDKIHLR